MKNLILLMLLSGQLVSQNTSSLKYPILSDAQHYIVYDSVPILIKSFSFNDSLLIDSILYSDQRDRHPDNYYSCYNYNNEQMLAFITYKNMVTKYLYNNNNQLIGNFLFYKKDSVTLDTLMSNSIEYNPQGLIQSELSKNYIYHKETYRINLTETGLKEYNYLENGKIQSMDFTANCCIEGDIHLNDYKLVYTYINDSTYVETQINNLDNGVNNMFWEKKHVFNSNGQLIKTIEKLVQFVELKLVDNKYIPDPESITADYTITESDFIYDNLGRLMRVNREISNNDKNTKKKYKLKFYELMKYKDSSPFKIGLDFIF